VRLSEEAGFPVKAALLAWLAGNPKSESQQREKVQHEAYENPPFNSRHCIAHSLRFEFCRRTK
jgi:hypothetical protein